MLRGALLEHGPKGQSLVDLNEIPTEQKYERRTLKTTILVRLSLQTSNDQIIRSD